MAVRRGDAVGSGGAAGNFGRALVAEVVRIVRLVQSMKSIRWALIPDSPTIPPRGGGAAFSDSAILASGTGRVFSVGAAGALAAKVSRTMAIAARILPFMGYS